MNVSGLLSKFVNLINVFIIKISGDFMEKSTYEQLKILRKISTYLFVGNFQNSN